MIKYILFIAMINIFVANPAMSQVLSDADDSAKFEIRQLTKKWYEAIKLRDSVALDQILTADYTVNGSWPKSRWMNNILHHFKMDSFEVASEPRMDVFDDAAISEGTLYWKGTRDGKPFMNAEFGVTDIWVKRNDRWQVHMRLLKFLKNRN